MARTDDLEEGSRRSIEIEGRAVLLFKLAGEFFAVEDLCSHDGQPLTEGAVVAGAIECPRHGARFDLKTGRPLCMPAIEPIPIFPVKIEGMEIWVGTQPA